MSIHRPFPGSSVVWICPRPAYRVEPNHRILASPVFSCPLLNMVQNYKEIQEHKSQKRTRTLISLNINSMIIIKMMDNKLAIVIFFPYLLALASESLVHSFPLTYAFTPDFRRKFPIKLSFNSSQTTLPFQSDQLYLFNLNLTMNILEQKSTDNQQDLQAVIIGLKQPSTFLYAVQSTFKVPPHQIEFGKGEYLELLINDNSFVESPDYFVNEKAFTMRVLYNFGNQIQVNDQICQLIDSSDIYFDEIFIRRLLTSMDKRNQIQYQFNEHKNVIKLSGNLNNFPKITLKRQNSMFELSVDHSVLKYIPRAQNDTKGKNKIGFHALKTFSKFEIDHENIIFKRTSQFYQLYLFLGYFFGFTLMTLICIRGNMFQSMKFVRDVMNWMVFENPQSRLEVLRTELE